jgi:hypothetical protein
LKEQAGFAQGDHDVLSQMVNLSDGALAPESKDR